MKIGDKSCKIRVDSGSCINAVSSKLVSMIGLKAVPHPYPYKVSWVNTMSIEVNERCLVPVKFATYKNKIWCSVRAMSTMGHVILGRPWLFDLDVTLRGKSNRCSKWRPQRLHRPGKFIGDGDISGILSKIGCQNRTVNIHIFFS